MTNYPGGDDAMAIWTGKSRAFHDPFLLPSSNAMPTELQSALDFCLYLYYLNPLYRRASIRVVSHFITSIEFVNKTGSQEERDALKDYLINQLDLFSILLEVGQEWACFAGETNVVTRDGVFAIKDLAGKRVDVLSKGGAYRSADFKSYGKQKLMEVEFSDGRKVYATPEHQWEVLNNSGKEVKLPTSKLKNRFRIVRTAAPRPEKNEEYYEGVRHGFVFGDGSLSSGGKRSTAMFCGVKDLEMMQYFEGLGNAPRQREDRKEMIRQSGFSPEYKSLPANDRSASYWYGFVCGFLAADGSVDVHGCALLTQSRKYVMEAVVAQLPRIGMVAGPIKHSHGVSTFTRPDGSTYTHEGDMYCATLLKRFMLPQDFLISKHKDNFIKHFNAESVYGKYVAIKSVKTTDRFEEVFCCEEQETNSFVIDNGILTSNCYGNAYIRLHLPFDRVLIDHRGGKYREYALTMFGQDIKYDYKTMTYDIPDPLSFDKPVDKRTRVSLPFIDRPSRDKDRIRLRKLDPRQVVLQYSFMSGKNQIIYRFEADFLTLIKKGVLHQVNETPMSMLKAISLDQDFLFNEGQVFHFKAPTISGVSNYGWGLPETIANYRHIHQLQVLRKIDEVVGMDYMLPFRLFSPEAATSSNDPMNYMLMSRWGSEIKEIIKRRRADPFSMHALPFPVTYQEFGAQGKTLAPKELVEYHNDVLLDAMGYPAELFKGSLQIQQVPTAIRLFENSFYFIQQGFDKILKWATRRVLDYIGQQQIGVELMLPRVADNLEKASVYMQLAAGAEIPRSIAYAPFGIKDPVEAVKQRAQEDIEIQKEQQKLQQDFEREQTVGSMDAVINAQGQQAQGGGSSPAGDDASGPQGGGEAMSPMDIEGKAQQHADEILKMPVGERQKALANIKASNPNLHALTKQKMEEKRSQAASDGVKALSQPDQ